MANRSESEMIRQAITESSHHSSPAGHGQAKPGLSVEDRGPHLMAASRRTPEAEVLLTPAEVATIFRVDPKTVTRWAQAGKLTAIRTPGGHRRFPESEVRALLAGTWRAPPAA
jgi:excisionase family DNA binding protein